MKRTIITIILTVLVAYVLSYFYSTQVVNATKVLKLFTYEKTVFDSGQAYMQVEGGWVKIYDTPVASSMERANLLNEYINNTNKYKIILNWGDEAGEYYFDNYTDLCWFAYTLTRGL